MIRILSNLLLILSVFLLPFYISFVLIILFTFFIDDFIEGIIFGALIDILYGGGSIFSIGFAYFFTAIIFIFYLFSFRLKEMLRLSF